MTTLAIDTATRTIGLGISRPDEVLYETSWHSDNFHTVELAPAVKAALKQSGTRRQAIKSIALAIGPGSYTGLRIGLAFAKGMAFESSLPIIPVPTLDILAAGYPLDERPLIAIIQAGRGRLTAAHYALQGQAWAQTREPYITTVDDLYDSIHEDSILCGELSVADRKRLARKHKKAQLAPPSLCLRRPSVLAELALSLPEEEVAARQKGLTPAYVKTEAALPA